MHHQLAYVPTYRDTSNHLIAASTGFPGKRRGEYWTSPGKPKYRAPGNPELMSHMVSLVSFRAITKDSNSHAMLHMGPPWLIIGHLPLLLDPSPAPLHPPLGRICSAMHFGCSMDHGQPRVAQRLFQPSQAIRIHAWACLPQPKASSLQARKLEGLALSPFRYQMPSNGGKLPKKSPSKMARNIDSVANDLLDIQIKEARSKIFKLLKEKPTQVLPCLHALETNFFEKKEVGAKAAQWPSTYMRFDQIPKYWLAALLSELEPALTDEKLRQMDAADKEAVRQVVEYACGVRPMQKLPGLALIRQSSSRP